MEINYTSIDTSVWYYSGDIRYNVDIIDSNSAYWQGITMQATVWILGSVGVACITAFIPAFYEKLIYKLNNDYGYYLPTFSNTSAGQYYFASTVGNNIGYVCGLDSVCTEVHIEQNLDHIANNI